MPEKLEISSINSLKRNLKILPIYDKFTKFSFHGCVNETKHLWTISATCAKSSLANTLSLLNTDDRNIQLTRKHSLNFVVDETVPNTKMSVEPMRSLRFKSSLTPL